MICPICADNEWIPIPDMPQSMQPCPNCYARKRAERLQAICGLNENERRVTLDMIKPNGAGTRQCVEAARAFIASPTSILTLYGGSGNAKTLILQAVVNACLEQQISAIYATFYNAVNFVREAVKTDAESAWKRLDRLQRVQVLCLDECDKVKVTEWVEELESELFDLRYRSALAGTRGTLLAMNKSPEEVLPVHTVSRLRDTRNTVIHNTDRDFRPLIPRLRK